MALSGFGQVYKDNLQDLTTPERRSIVTLKDLAFENPEEAASVVEAIRQHIKQCPAAHRLPALFLLDCILKTDGPAVYLQHINGVLKEIFVSIWDKADAATRTTLAKVCKLWKDVRGLDQTVVAACEGHMGAAGQGAVPMAAAASAASTSGRPYAGAPQPGLGRPQVGVGGNRVPFDPRALGPQAVYQQPAASFPQRPAMASTQPPISVSAPSYPQQPTYTASAPPAILVPLQGYGQQQQLQAQPQFIAVPHPQIPGQFQYLPIPAGFQAPQPSVLPPVPMAPLTAVQPQSMPPRSPQVAPSSPEQAQALQQLAAVPGRPRSTVFPAGQLLKALDSTAVKDLLDASARTRPGFLDAAFLRNKRKAAHAGSASRQWYPTVDLWFLGTASTQGEGDTIDNEEADGKEELHFVEEDPSQPECAISGEPFERFYDPDSDKWCYKDAVLLTGEEAAKYGVMEGSIVKVHCLAGAPSKLQLSRMRAAADTASAAEDLRAAAAATPALPAAPTPASTPPQQTQPATHTAAGAPVHPVEQQQEQQQPAAAASAEAHAALAGPAAVAVKPEPQSDAPVGVVGPAGGAAGGLSAGAKRGAAGLEGAGSPGGAVGLHGALPEGLPDALASKRVKLEVQ